MYAALRHEIVLIGSYSVHGWGSGQGIVALRREGSKWAQFNTGRYPNPSFLARAGAFTLVTEELTPGRLRLVDDRLTEVSSMRLAGNIPASVAIRSPGTTAAVALYGSGGVEFVAMKEGHLRSIATWHASGRGPNPERQTSPHPHIALPFGDQDWLVADLGTDRLTRLQLSRGGVLDRGSVALPGGTGPRHLATIEGGRVAVSGELAGTVGVVDLTDGANQSSHIFVPASKSSLENSPSHVATGSGDVIYVANRGPDTLSAFRMIVSGGIVDLRLENEVPTGGAWPRHFAVVGDRILIANQLSDSVTSVRLDKGGIPQGPPSIAATVHSPAFVLPL